jgi:hypothetical protein
MPKANFAKQAGRKFTLFLVACSCAVDKTLSDIEVTLHCRCEEMCKTLKYLHNNNLEYMRTGRPADDPVTKFSLSKKLLFDFHSHNVHPDIIKFILFIQPNAPLDYSRLKRTLEFTLKCSYMFRLTNHHQGAYCYTLLK